MIPPLPVVEKSREERVEVLLRWCPRFQEIVIESDLVDGPDRDVRVGVGGEQHTLGVRVELERLAKKLDAAHPGHPLVHQEQGDRLFPQPEGVQNLQRLIAGSRLHDPVLLAVFPVQVPGDGRQDRGIIIDGENHRVRHWTLLDVGDRSRFITRRPAPVRQRPPVPRAVARRTGCGRAPTRRTRLRGASGQ